MGSGQEKEIGYGPILVLRSRFNPQIPPFQNSWNQHFELVKKFGYLGMMLQRNYRFRNISKEWPIYKLDVICCWMKRLRSQDDDNLRLNSCSQLPIVRTLLRLPYNYPFRNISKEWSVKQLSLDLVLRIYSCYSFDIWPSDVDQFLFRV